MKTIEELTKERKNRLLSTITWSQRVIYSIETWPCYNIITDLGTANMTQIICGGCNQRGIASRFILYGQPYNANTIETVQPDNRLPYEKVIERIS